MCRTIQLLQFSEYFAPIQNKPRFEFLLCQQILFSTGGAVNQVYEKTSSVLSATEISWEFVHSWNSVKNAGIAMSVYSGTFTRFKSGLSKNLSPGLVKIHRVCRNSTGFAEIPRGFAKFYQICQSSMTGFSKSLQGFAKNSLGLGSTGAVTRGRSLERIKVQLSF